MKSRGNFQVNICLKVDCLNQPDALSGEKGEKDICDKCFKFSNYEPLKEEDAPSK